MCSVCLFVRCPRLAIAVATVCLGALAISGCGNYVSCDERDKNGGCIVVSTGGGPDLAEFENATRLEHLALAAVLRRYTVSEKGNVLVDYHGISASIEARHTLGRYLASMAAVDPTKLESPAERLVFWFNAYNAAVVQGVLDNYEGSESYRVTDVSGFFARLVTVGGQQLTLDQIEHVIVRKDDEHASARGLSAAQRELFARFHRDLWAGKTPDPRLHVAFNCAALSCPDLLDSEPFVYQAATLESQLAANTRAWLDHEKGASAAGISKLFEWYGKDFVAAEGSIEAFIAKHRTAGLAGIDTSRTLDYDWTLNIVKK